MSSNSAQRKRNNRVPLGIVFITVGLFIIGAVLMILFVSPYNMPDNIAHYADVALTQIPYDFAELGYESLREDDPLAQIPILLPESAPITDKLPSFASVEEAPKDYSSSVSSMPERLIVPSLGIDVNVSPVRLLPQERNGQRYFQWQVPSGYEVGWHDSSAPLGLPGNTVLNGHNNIHGEVFRNLINLKIGEQIILYDSESEYRYEVVQQEILPENGQPISVRLLNARFIEPTRDERITLVSCWPYATNSHRLVVVAKPVN